MLDIDEVMSSVELSDGVEIYEALETVQKILIINDDLSDTWLISITDYDECTRSFQISQDYESSEIKRWFVSQGVERDMLKIRN